VRRNELLVPDVSFIEALPQLRAGTSATSAMPGGSLALS
jgi:hypothetical protein